MKEQFVQVVQELLTPGKKEFKKYFPHGEIKKIYREQIPQRAINFFLEKNDEHTHPDEFIEDHFEDFFAVGDYKKVNTFIARQTFTYSNHQTDQLTYLIDLNKNNEYLGEGEMRKSLTNEDPYFKNKPSVTYSRTDAKYLRKGLGTRRLHLMNAVSQMTYGHSLNSDSVLSPEAKLVWENLVKKGEAIKYEEGLSEEYSVPRFVFKSDEK